MSYDYEVDSLLEKLNQCHNDLKFQESVANSHLVSDDAGVLKNIDALKKRKRHLRSKIDHFVAYTNRDNGRHTFYISVATLLVLIFVSLFFIFVVCAQSYLIGDMRKSINALTNSTLIAASNATAIANEPPASVGFDACSVLLGFALSWAGFFTLLLMSGYYQLDEPSNSAPSDATVALPEQKKSNVATTDSILSTNDTKEPISNSIVEPASKCDS